jgi:hypothetical protein
MQVQVSNLLACYEVASLAKALVRNDMANHFAWPNPGVSSFCSVLDEITL